jgi:hypothetical protein
VTNYWALLDFWGEFLEKGAMKLLDIFPGKKPVQSFIFLVKSRKSSSFPIIYSTNLLKEEKLQKLKTLEKNPPKIFKFHKSQKFSISKN